VLPQDPAAELKEESGKANLPPWVYAPTSASLRNIETDFTRKVIVTDERARKNAENAARRSESQRGLNERTDPNRPKSLRLKRRFLAEALHTQAARAIRGTIRM
jgi:hypothetical protein